MSKIPVKFGLIQQGHISLIEKMLNENKTWIEIGNVIHWDVETLKQHYFIYIYESNKILKDIINDLTLSLGMRIGGYPFDEHHKIKQLRLIDEACRLIGKPRTIEELKEMIINIKRNR